MRDRLVSLAVRYRRAAKAITLAGGIGTGIVLGFGALLTKYSDLAMPAAFLFFAGLMFLGWIVQGIASLSDPDGVSGSLYVYGLHPRGRRVKRKYAAATTAFFFLIAVGLIVAGIVILAIFLRA